jgi:serine phosphatase RsbU (regulator of sigma subunit)
MSCEKPIFKDMRHFLLYVFGLILISNSLAQDFSVEEQNAIDSLSGLVKNPKSPDSTKIEARLSIANYYYNHNLDTAFILCHEAEKLAEKIDWLPGKTNSYGWLGYLYNSIGDLDKALEYNMKSMELARISGDINSITTLLNNNAIIYTSFGQSEEALNCHIEALRLHENSGDKAEIARSVTSIALLMKNQGFVAKAIDLYEVSLKMRRALGDKADIAETLNNLGVIFASRGDYDKAEKYYKESLQLRKEANRPSAIANSLNNLGNLMNNIELYDSALVYLYESLEIREKYGLAPGICESAIDIGFAFYAKGNLKKAEIYSLKGYKMAKEFGYVRLIKNATGTIYKIYLDQNNKALAFDFFKEHVQMRDSLINKDTQRRTAQMDANYAYEKQKTIDDANHQKKLALEEEKQKRQKLMLYWGALGLSLVILFLLFVFNRLRITKNQKSIIEQQKEEVQFQKKEVEMAHQNLEEKNTEILDSITYAKRIQSAILPQQSVIKKYIPESFILYKPKDIVAGDFYWFEQLGDKTLIAAADCTGHGVPGALVSVVCNNCLNRSVREYGISEPGQILDKTREIIIQEFEKSEEAVKDGMDIALCSIKGNTLKYAGAHNPLWIIRNNSLIEYKADKQPVGKFDQLRNFKTHTIELEKGDTFYIFSDGFSDQFGGERGKKLKSKNFKEILLSIQGKSLEEQKLHLNTSFEKWRGDFEQLDDVCVIGIRLSK